MLIPPRVVVTYTTIPDRYDMLKKSLLSIVQQDYPIDTIYLTIPQKCKRLGTSYGPIPQDIQEICKVIYTDIDYGPITKIYGALSQEDNPETIFISCDDDVIYHKSLVRILVEYSCVNPHIAICGTGALIGRGLLFISIVSSLIPFKTVGGITGFNTPPEGRAIDLVYGVGGVLYRRGFFPRKDRLVEDLFKYSLMNDAVFLNDDILISGYLQKKGIERRLYYNIPDVDHAQVTQSGLSYNIWKMMSNMNLAITEVKSHGFFTEMESLPLDETMVWKSGVLLILLVVIVVVSICFYLLLQ